MPKNSVTYKLLCRFETLIQSVDNLNTLTERLQTVRYKPIYTSYNSCISDFELHFRREYIQLNLEPLPLYDESGNELFTNNKLSTLLHQAQSVVAVLKGSLPPGYSGGPETLKESIAWYWHNTHPKAIIAIIILFFTIFCAGIFFGKTDFYGKVVAPIIAQYRSQNGNSK